jgi:flagellar motor switch protein FliM
LSGLLEPGEVEALLKAVEGGAFAAGAAPAGPVSDWDFRRPERVTKERMLALRNLHELFARSFAASLSGLLRTVAEVKLASLAQVPWQAFAAALPNPTCVAVFSCAPEPGHVLVEIGPAAMFPLIDRLLGGGLPVAGRAPVRAPERPLTAIEWSLAEGVFRKAAQDLEQMWAGVRRLSLAPVATESNPLLVQAMPPDELMLAAAFDLRVGESGGRVHVCVPLGTTEGFLGGAPAHAWHPAARPAAAPPAIAEGPLGEAQVRVSVELARATVTVRELVALEPGDVIETRTRAGAPAAVLVEGRPKFEARAATYRGHYAAEVQGPGGKRE